MTSNVLTQIERLKQIVERLEGLVPSSTEHETNLDKARANQIEALADTLSEICERYDR